MHLRHKSENTEQAILRVLSEAETPMGGSQIGRRLLAMGIDLSQRTVRLHLLQLDQQGLTRLVSRRGGRVLTALGRQEAAATTLIEKIDFMATRIDALGYRMNLDIKKGRGTVILNLTYLSEADFRRAAPMVRSAFAAGLGLGRLMLVRRAGQQIAGLTVGEGEVVLGTICSFTVNGVMLHHGVPVRSRYGGLLEVRDRQPLRFTALVDYEGTTIDPLETFIRARMTSVAQVAATGRGIIGASFREVPAGALAKIEKITERLKAIGLSGSMLTGRPNQELMGVPVPAERAGLVVPGGMNPIAVVYEAGLNIRTQAMACLVEFNDLADYEEALGQ